MADIFISYSSEDRPIVKQIAGLLENKGWTVWWDRQIPIGQKFDNVIENELHKAACVLVVWTQSSITSEWVKSEASEGAQKGNLLPVVLEQITLPLAFKRIESAMLTDWKGEQDHPELDLLFNSIESIIGHKNETVKSNNVQGVITNPSSTTIKNSSGSEEDNTILAERMPGKGYGIITGIGLLVSFLMIFYYLQNIQGIVAQEVDHRIFYLILILFGISASALIFGVMNTYAVLKGKKQDVQLKMTGPGVGVILIVLGGLYLPQSSAEKNVTIRLFDWKKNPVTQGEVKIYLNEYIRTQSIDNMGQALFTGIPADVVKNKMKIEVSSPGYATQYFDTLVINSKPLEITLPLTTVVYISGKVKTAAEIPIKGVEIDVTGTRYYAISITDGSYKLRLEEYTIGDEITLSTSQKDYEDKSISLTINSPDMKNQDIFLNPITR